MKPQFYFEPTSVALSCTILISSSLRISSRNLNHRLLHRTAFTHSDFYTQTPFRIQNFTLRRLDTEQLWHRKAFAQSSILHREAFAHSSLYTQRLLRKECFTQRSLYTEQLLHTNAFMHRRFYAEKPVHRATFTDSRIYTQISFTHLYTQKRLHRRTFTERNCYTQTPTEVFTQESFYTKKSSHKACRLHAWAYQASSTHGQYSTNYLPLALDLELYALFWPLACAHRKIYAPTKKYLLAKLYQIIVSRNFIIPGCHLVGWPKATEDVMAPGKSTKLAETSKRCSHQGETRKRRPNRAPKRFCFPEKLKRFLPRDADERLWKT